MNFLRSRLRRLIERTALAGAVSLLWSTPALADGCAILIASAGNARELESRMNSAAERGFTVMSTRGGVTTALDGEVRVVMSKCSDLPARRSYRVVPADESPNSVGLMYVGTVVFGGSKTAVIVER